MLLLRCSEMLGGGRGGEAARGTRSCEAQPKHPACFQKVVSVTNDPSLHTPGLQQASLLCFTITGRQEIAFP